MLDDVALAYGGFDSICVTAGVFVPSDTTGHIPDEKWAMNFAVNVTGGYLVADEAAKDVEGPGPAGSLVLTTSANAVVAKRGSLAYDTSKAAANHLVRELAIELAPLVRVNGVAPRRWCREAPCSPGTGSSALSPSTGFPTRTTRRPMP
jgi:NAD(P)-dependent dehydrogenase (short-subunit alcohol dehydrogenase family)